jgi:hypothetical protein
LTVEFAPFQCSGQARIGSSAERAPNRLSRFEGRAGRKPAFSFATKIVPAVGRFLAVHPEQLHLHALDLVLLALHEAFPSKQLGRPLTACRTRFIPATVCFYTRRGVNRPKAAEKLRV